VVLYLDPAMVLVTCLVFLPVPIRLMRATLLELLEGAPPAAILREAETRMEAVHRSFGLDEAATWMTKVGPKPDTEVEGIADPNVTVAEEHELRTAPRG
jgi:predicted Co/Zn/Cd cation transporter (cation efflux family)